MEPLLFIDELLCGGSGTLGELEDDAEDRLPLVLRGSWPAMAPSDDTEDDERDVGGGGAGLIRCGGGGGALTGGGGGSDVGGLIRCGGGGGGRTDGGRMSPLAGLDPAPPLTVEGKIPAARGPACKGRRGGDGADERLGGSGVLRGNVANRLGGGGGVGLDVSC